MCWRSCFVLYQTYIRFKTSEGICSSASKKQKGRITVSVGPMSSIAIPLIIIPMELKEQWIEAEAYSSNRNDAIRKNLKVVVSLPCQHLEEGSGDFCRNKSWMAFSLFILFKIFRCLHQVAFVSVFLSASRCANWSPGENCADQPIRASRWSFFTDTEYAVKMFGNHSLNPL